MFCSVMVDRAQKYIYQIRLVLDADIEEHVESIFDSVKFKLQQNKYFDFLSYIWY